MLPRLRSFLATLVQRQRFEDSLDEEMRFHLDAQTEDLVRTGIPPPEAARRARAQFGSVEAMKNECRRVRGLWIADGLGPHAPHAPPVRSVARPEVFEWPGAVTEQVERHAGSAGGSRVRAGSATSKP